MIDTNVKTTIWAAAAMVLIALTLHADPLPRTVQQCVELGLENSESLHMALMETRAAGARVRDQRSELFPGPVLTASYMRLSETDPMEVTLPPPASETLTLAPSIENNYALELSLSQPLFTGLRLSSSIHRLDSLYGASLARYERERQILVFDIERQYWELMKTREMVKVIEENIAQVEAHLGDVREFHEQGLVTYNEVLKVEMRLADTSLLLIETGSAVELAQIRLNMLLGLPRETLLPELDDRARVHPLPDDLDRLSEEGESARTDLAAARYHVRAGEAAVTQSRSGWFPQLFLAGNIRYAQPNQRIFPPEEQLRTTWEMGVTARIDLGDWYSAPHRTEQARAELSRSRDRLALTREGVVFDVVQSYSRLRNSLERIDVARRYIRQAEENHRIVREKFGAGLARNTDLLDAELELLQSRLKLTQAWADHEVAWAALRAATGRPREEQEGDAR